LKSTTNQQNQRTKDRNNIALLKQKRAYQGLVQDNFTMLTSEERLFSFGESSCFNKYRENNLVSAQLARIALENRFYISNSELLK
jgi:hypothetical protein